MLFEGNFIDGVKQGKGRMVLGNGDIYEGDFKDNFPNGRGMYKSVDKDCTFVGEFKNAKIIKGR